MVVDAARTRTPVNRASLRDARSHAAHLPGSMRQRSHSPPAASSATQDWVQYMGEPRSWTGRRPIPTRMNEDLRDMRACAPSVPLARSWEMLDPSFA